MAEKRKIGNSLEVTPVGLGCMGFSHAYGAPTARKEAVGMIHRAYDIEQVRTYSADHMKMIYEAKEELDSDARPELKQYPDGIEEYDTVILAFPNWWNTLPMPVVTFLTRYDFSGKKIIPFNTSGGGGFGRSVADIKKYAPGAEVAEGMTVPGTKVEASKTQIQDWAKAQV